MPVEMPMEKSYYKDTIERYHKGIQLL